jgi:hypothetical protein
VFVALGVRDGRQEPRVDTALHGDRNRGFGDRLGHRQIGDQRKMRTVLLDRSEWLNEDRRGRQRSLHLGASQMGEMARRHERRLSVRA